MAPELEDGRAESITPASDVYSLGKLLYWLLSGGRVFSREKHREKAFDLCEITPGIVPERILLEHINRLLDKMIVADPRGRHQNLDEVIHEIRFVSYLIRHNYNPLSSEVSHICRYCGLASYQLIADGNPAAVEHVGLRGHSDLRIMKCRNCGHLEIFKTDSWWGPK
jgi:serine/threonine protein kinase